MAQVLLTGESSFLSLCDFKELRVEKGHVRQPLRDEPVDKPSAAWGEPILGDQKNLHSKQTKLLSSYSSRFSAHLRLYGFVIGIVSGADVAHGFPVLVCSSSYCPQSCAR